MAGTVVDTLVSDLADAASPRSVQTGGTLTVGITSDFISTYNEFDNYPNISGQVGSWSSDQFCVGEAIFDPLFVMNKQGTGVLPCLALSATGSKNYTVWTIKLRSGVKFHSGATFNAAAVVANYKAAAKAPPVSLAIAPIIKSVVAKGSSVVYTTYIPYYNFPIALAETQIAFMADPAMLSAGSTLISGTGPFMLTYANWNLGHSYAMTANPHYWRKDANGNSLPYLANLNFQVIADNGTRLSSLKGGSIDIAPFFDGLTQSAVISDGSLTHVDDRTASREPAKTMVLCNTTGLDYTGAAGNTTSGSWVQTAEVTAAVADVRIRKALAYAIDTATYLASVDNGIGSVANGILRPQSPFYKAPATAYPTYSLSQANTLLASYINDNPGWNKKIGCTYQNTPTGETQFGFLESALAALTPPITLVGHGLDVADAIQQVELKQYELTFWAQFGGFTPDNNYVWWMCSWAAANGTKLTPGFNQNSIFGAGYNKNINQANFVNFANYADPVVEAAMLKAMGEKTVASQKTYWATVNSEFAANVPYLWLDQTVSMWAANSNVNNWQTATAASATSTKSKTACYSPVGGVLGWAEIWTPKS